MRRTPSARAFMRDRRSCENSERTLCAYEPPSFARASVNMRLILQSFAIKFALDNRRAGGDSFVAIFAQKGRTNHAEDMPFMTGLFQHENMTTNDRLMDVVLPSLMRRFIKGERRPVASESRCVQTY